MAKISILVPVYNAKDFLYDSIPSLLNQSFEDLEIICVNDGSKDNSLEILNEFASEDSRVKVFDKENGGCGSARNYAIEQATGDYIYFFDPDGRIESDALELAYDSAVKNNSDLVIFKANTFVENGSGKEEIFFNYTEISEKDYGNVPLDVIRSYVLRGGYAPWSKLYKKEFLDSYDDFRFDLRLAFDDVPFHVKTILRAKKVSYINKILYHYRVDNVNSVNSTSSNGFDIFKIIDKVENILKEEDYYDVILRRFSIFKVCHILYYIISTNSVEYFNIAKEKFKEVDSSFFEDKHNLKRRYDLVLECDDFESFKPKYEALLLEKELKDLKEKQVNLDSINKELQDDQLLLNNEIKSLKKDQLNLKRTNKKLKKEVKQLKKEKKELSNSRSWKITKPLRKLINLF